ncbi:MAG: hypothetical protein KDA57_03085 [Planctomycetales bacterium]|nr:hypothetical protein [Planctomycetales bacterium]
MRIAVLVLALGVVYTRAPLAAQSVVDVALAESPPVDKPPLLLAAHLAQEKDGFRVVPYGAFWSDMIYASQRTNPGSFTLYVLSEEDQGEPAFTLDARRSRFGLDLFGPTIPTAEPLKTGGRVEIDFQGRFVVENSAAVLLRHAYWEAYNDSQRILIGQNWDVISPLIPRTLNYAAGYSSGNLGFRRAQFRYDRYFTCSERTKLILQTSLNQDIVADFATDSSVRRESADWPVIEGRAALSFDPGADGRLTTLGVSGHIGETGFDFLEAGPPPLSLPPQDDARFETWSYNLDFATPLGERAHLQAEFFHGKNLSPQLGGIGQGICPCVREPIESIGGWVDVQYVWTPKLRTHVGYGIDDPNDDDMLLGRVSNQVLFVNLTCDVTPQLLTGLETSYWKTHYQETRGGLVPDDQLGPTAPGEAVVVEFMVKYSF